MDWHHAQLEPLRDFLRAEAQAGRFEPAKGLPL